MNAETFVLSWSQIQCAFHVETIGQMLTDHNEAFVADRELQHIPLMFGSRPTIDAALQKLRPGLLKRRALRLDGRAGSIPWNEVKHTVLEPEDD